MKTTNVRRFKGLRKGRDTMYNGGRINVRGVSHSGMARGVVLVLAILCPLMMPSGADACDCDCYFSSDCGWGSLCVYNSCRQWYDDGKLKDGDCKFWAIFSISHMPDAADSLEYWLLAYEAAGGNGGGPPDPELVALAQSVPLSADQHEVIRKMAMSVQQLYLGLENPAPDHGPGFFTFADVPDEADCDDPLPEGDHGSVLPLDACHLAVGALIRQALVGELQTPQEGVFDSFMSQIPTVCPGYQTFERCEGVDKDFPYPDGLTCLTEELRSWVNGLLLGEPIPTVSEWGLIVLALLLLTAGTIVFGRRRRPVAA